MWLCYASFSCTFLALNILLMFNYLLFIFILDYGNEVRQKANSRDFLIRVHDGS